jgi:hypothetical protein
MSYPEIYIPINKNIYDLSSKEAQGFNDWFVDNLEERVKILEDTVKKDDEHRFWHANYKRESLQELGEWLYANLAAVEQTHDGIEQGISDNKYPGWFADIVRETSSNKKFSDETYRKCFDVAIYFGETVRKAVPSLKWSYKTTKTFAHKNQPILVKDGNKASLNPRNIVEGLAGKFMRGEAAPNKLQSTFDVWVNLFK